MGRRRPVRARVRFTVLDAVIIGLVLGGTGLLAWRVYADNGAPPALHVKAEGGEWFYPLAKDREILLQGPLGLTRVRIENGAARVVESACPEKLCVRHGSIRANKQCVACLPNKVLIYVEGREAGPYDAETY